MKNRSPSDGNSERPAFPLSYRQRVQQCPLAEVSPDHELHKALAAFDTTFITHVEWADKLIASGNIAFGCDFLIDRLFQFPLSDNGVHRTLTQSVDLLRRFGSAEQAESMKRRAEIVDPAYNLRTSIGEWHKDKQWLSIIEALEPYLKNEIPNAFIGNELGNAQIKSGQRYEGVQTLKATWDAGNGNAQTAVLLGLTMIEDGRIADAFNIASVAASKWPGGAQITSLLGKTLLLTARTSEAIAILKPEWEKIPDEKKGKRINKYLADVLADAYASSRSRADLETLEPYIGRTRFDFLHAKLSYFDGDVMRAMRLLRPHVEADFHGEEVTLFLACLADDSPVHSILRSRMGEDTYQWMLRRRDEWRTRPERMSLEGTPYATATRMYELGAVPVSGSDRNKAGLAGQAPVAVRFTKD